MPELEVGGQSIHYEQYGKSNRQVAVLIHGWSSSGYALSPLAGMLAQRFRCIAVDLPGYGHSPAMRGRTTIQRYIDILADLIESLSDGPVVLIGHSMGGMISVGLAAQHPALVERLVLICPTITGRLSGLINTMIAPITLMERFGLGSLIVSAVERVFVGITDRLMRPVSFAERSDITEKDYARLREDARHPGQGKVRAECYFAMREFDLSGKLGGVDTPCLVIWGAEDNTVPLRDAGVLADEWPAADLRILPKAGHWPHFETPLGTRRLIAAYLGLPRTTDQPQEPVGDDTFYQIGEIGRFLAHSDLGRNLSDLQRTRLAAQFAIRRYEANQMVAAANTTGDEMYVIYRGVVEVWSDPDGPGHNSRPPILSATLKPGQMTGELAMLDGGARSADLIAGPEGATVLSLSREHLLSLCEDDTQLGTQLLWNIATAMSQRVRFILWQLQRALQRTRQESLVN